MSLLELKGLILPWLDLPTLMNLRQTCHALREPIQRFFVQTFDDSILFVQTTHDREADSFRTGNLSMDSWICRCGQKNPLTYPMNGSVPILSELSRNVCGRCGETLKMTRLFVGQLKREHTLPSILWTIRMLCPDIQIITIENRIDQATKRNKGCCWITVIDWTADMLLGFHRRILFDSISHFTGQLSGFWVVPNHPSWISYLDQLVYRKLANRCRSLPRKPMVVEVANMQVKNSSSPAMDRRQRQIQPNALPSLEDSLRMLTMDVEPNVASSPGKNQRLSAPRYQTMYKSEFARTPRKKAISTPRKLSYSDENDQNRAS
ncbi:hypothetical protein XU18_2291 [Perkinsela sp. CCAP 1560/4]|nr:hypothetical protein XU18_2291 [Perkinsela sp. CCAP 1560/4]|eukprot:KNH07020.1 hypothetical protein XU18_2291 [Perkinsela sp. CCAP 1560/4]